jgi:hypothetical protein
VQEEVAAVTYWHAELRRHDVLLAEGLPAESYLDSGDRDGFGAAEPLAVAGPQGTPTATSGVIAAS